VRYQFYRFHPPPTRDSFAPFFFDKLSEARKKFVMSQICSRTLYAYQARFSLASRVFVCFRVTPEKSFKACYQQLFCPHRRHSRSLVFPTRGRFLVRAWEK
jgi:hypothetical protein